MIPSKALRDAWSRFDLAETAVNYGSSGSERPAATMQDVVQAVRRVEFEAKMLGDLLTMQASRDAAAGEAR